MFRLDLSVTEEGAETSRLVIQLHNLTKTTLKLWELHFSFGRYILPETITGGTILQTGSNCRFYPDMAKNLLPGEIFTFEFEAHTWRLRFHTDSIGEAYISTESERYPVTLTTPQLFDVHKEQIFVPETKASFCPLIPRPQSLSIGEGEFDFSSGLTISEVPEAAKSAIKWLSSEIEKKQGQTLQIQGQAPDYSVDNNLIITENSSMKTGSYKLKVTPESIKITAGDKYGFTYASSTLLQLMFGKKRLFCLEIQDHSRFGYRGFMLDCVRHFYSIDQIKAVINQLAYYKINRFHWHLTDDEGWRIEINAFPELTEIGAWRGPGKQLAAQYSHLNCEYGGYYSQKEIKDVIEFAKLRGITVIPEIDIPGHCRAAIKSLPHLLIDPEDNSEYRSIQNYTDNVLNPALDGTYLFIDKVLEEVAELFPSPYVHIGGDEVPKGVWVGSPKCRALMKSEGYSDPKELQGHLLRYAENKLKTMNKRMLGWEEAYQGEKVSQDTIIYSWLSEEAALRCADLGFDVILQPGQFLYLDMAQGFSPQEHGIDWANPIPLEKIYSYEPLAELQENDPCHQRVLGVQCAIWTEYIRDQKQLDYMLYPRLLACAEIGWTEKQNRNWEDFLSRLKGHLPHLDNLDINYRDPWSR